MIHWILISNKRKNISPISTGSNIVLLQPYNNNSFQNHHRFTHFTAVITTLFITDDWSTWVLSPPFLGFFCYCLRQSTCRRHATGDWQVYLSSVSVFSCGFRRVADILVGYFFLFLWVHFGYAGPFWWWTEGFFVNFLGIFGQF